ncbi:hypothetical protein [Aureimonas sp. Leaf324]|uniref:hypothetical protein n=1 Tax=Aureimonas sp. Leaf324 TaxID=1736336 RepID=UPI000B0EF0E9|nr:hypothetical protein [Aureimonas sp. Leaf324]
MVTVEHVEGRGRRGPDGRHARRVARFFTAPERLIALVLAVVLGLLVIVPLFQLVRETVTVQPYDAAYLPGRQPGELTWFHYERVFSGRMSWALF